MPYIRIYDNGASEAREFECEEIRFGRDPEFEFVASGENREESWFVEDRESRNGTFLDGTRVASGTSARLTAGATVQLGTTGPSYRIEAIAKHRVSMTIAEDIPAVSPNDPTERMAAIDVPSPPPPASTPSPPPLPPPPLEESGPKEPCIVMHHEASGTRLEASGWQFRIGRGRECELRPVAQGDTSISRVHAQIEIKDDGSMLVRDAGSRNGTLVNGKLIDDECCLAIGDRLGL